MIQPGLSTGLQGYILTQSSQISNKYSSITAHHWKNVCPASFERSTLHSGACGQCWAHQCFMSSWTLGSVNLRPMRRLASCTVLRGLSAACHISLCITLCVCSKASNAAWAATHRWQGSVERSWCSRYQGATTGSSEQKTHALIVNSYASWVLPTWFLAASPTL